MAQHWGLEFWFLKGRHMDLHLRQFVPLLLEKYYHGPSKQVVSTVIGEG